MEDKVQAENSLEWRGYTLDELRYQRALSLVRLQMQKEKVSSGYESFKTGGATAGKASIADKLLGNLSIVDYAILGFKSYWKIRKYFKYISSLKKHVRYE